MKAFLLTLSFLPFTSNALENCVYFPVAKNTPIKYKGELTEISKTLSFGNCPEAVLVNNRFVARLNQIIENQGQEKCVYQISHSAAFMCEN